MTGILSLIGTNRLSNFAMYAYCFFFATSNINLQKLYIQLMFVQICFFQCLNYISYANNTENTIISYICNPVTKLPTDIE